MKIQFKPSSLKVRRQAVKWLVIHHTIELYDTPEIKIDNSKYQLQFIYNYVSEGKSKDINYHFIIEKVKQDYQVAVTRPFSYLCEWTDIDNNINERALHIALLGSYDFKIPENRLYEVLAYKLLNPLMNLFKIVPSHVKLHRDISKNEITCPGDFIDYAKVESMIRRFIVK